MADLAGIFNMALGLVGADADVQDPETDADKGAKACRVFWETVRDEVLRDFPWPKLSVTMDLTLVEEEPNDGIEWAFSYALPNNCLRVRRLLNGATRIDTELNRTAFKLGREDNSDDARTLVYCDLEDAQIEFTYHETNVGRYDADMASALAHRLAAAIAPKFGPEAVKLGDRALRIYQWRIANAQANAMNENGPDIQQDSSFERAR